MKTSAGLFLTDILPAKRRLFNKVVKNKVFGTHSQSEVFLSLKKSGVEGIELFLPSYAKKITFEDIQEVKDVLGKYKMPILSVHQALRFFTKTRINEITQLFHMADLLEAKVIVLHMSTAGKQIFDQGYVDVLHSLQKKYGIKIGFENREKVMGSFRNKHGWHEEKFSELMKEIGFNITLDTTHLAQAGGDIIKFFKANKDRIVNIHLSDYRKHRLNSSLRPFHGKHLPIGKGQLPMKKFLETLRDEKYKGLVTMEMYTDLKGMCESAKVINTLGKSNGKRNA